jgi:predicted TIM-barrel fold metal-dependent hydrolase
MRIIDADAHFHEPLDWLEQADPKLAEELPPPTSLLETFLRSRIETFPEELRPENHFELITQEFRAHLMKTVDLQPEHYERFSGNPHYDPAARLTLCDAEGVDVQFMNPTTSIVTGYLQTVGNGHPELLPRLLSAYNRWAADQLVDHTDRLIPVTEAFPSDVEWTIAEMNRMRAAGSRALHLTQNDERSYTHPDYEPMWSAAEDLGMAVYIHLPFGQSPHLSFARNDRGIETYLHLAGHGDANPMTRHFLTAMVFDGVFERHPRLAVILAECGHSWLPGFLFDIDAKTTNIGTDGKPQETFYKLPLKPSEYIRRHVRVSVMAGFIEAGFERLTLQEALDQLPDKDLLIFSSDYPHVEGREHAVPIFDELLPDDDKIREYFYGKSVAQHVGL